MMNVDKRLDNSEYNSKHINNQKISLQQQKQYINKTDKQTEQNYQDYEIDYKVLPYLFRFKYSALQRLKLRKTSETPKVAYQIFQYLKEKIVVRKYSECGKYSNRMKYQEKVKFLIRAFDHRRNSQMLEVQRKKQKFNRQKQIQFFSRKEVKQHFLTEIKQALARKKVENERRIKEIQDCIQGALILAHKQKDKSYHIFEQRIKRRQLPWTDNMFLDIEDFSKQLYLKFAINHKQQNQYIHAQSKVKMQDCKQRAQIQDPGSDLDDGQSSLSAKIQNNSTE